MQESIQEGKMRKLASIQKIEDIQPIEGADAIEKIKVLGWWVVAQKAIGYKVGDLVVYHEIDTFLPDGIPAYQFLVDKSSRVYNQRKGHVVRSIKLRGQISQGFCVPLEELMDILYLTGTPLMTVRPKSEPACFDWVEDLVGLDVTEMLGVEKYEPPVPASLSGLIKGNFPSSWRKTDQERVQNLEQEVLDAFDKDISFEVTIKLDGSSMSFGIDDLGEVAVCSRNLSLKLDQEGNTFVDTFKAIPNMAENLLSMKANGTHYVVQGELMGEGIQKNQEKLKGHRFFLYAIYDIQTGDYLRDSKVRRFIASHYGIDHVPILHESVTLRELGFSRENLVDDILSYADGESLTKGVKREGIVFKSLDTPFSFKAISNSWLLKNQD
jgi:RNA ligase (TIGR02306 family)